MIKIKYLASSKKGFSLRFDINKKEENKFDYDGFIDHLYEMQNKEENSKTETFSSEILKEIDLNCKKITNIFNKNEL